jgi:hypothetical protein
MTLNFVGGPVDGHSLDCPIVPPPVFYLPTRIPLTASVYFFDSFLPGVLKYTFEGYRKLNTHEARILFGERNLP